MTKGNNTRSGLLWEVERLLNECEELPQVLLMENVPQVHSKSTKKKVDENGDIVYDDKGNIVYEKSNYENFMELIEFLKSKGYSNYWQDLNARDYGVAQNRNRCFMVSILGDYNFKFPNPIPLKKVMKDYLEDTVDDKYYITSEKAKKLIDELILNGKILTEQNKTEQNMECIDLTINEPRIIERANCIKARYDDGISNLQADGSGVVEWNVIRKTETGNKTN